MNAEQPPDDKSKRFPLLVFSHRVAIIAGLLLTILGSGMAITIVLLPIGIPVLVAGLLVLTWGLYIWQRSADTTET